MLRKKINNIELQKLIAFKCNKLDFEEVTDDDLKQITDLTLSGRLINGRGSGMELDNIKSFPNLISLNIFDMEINQSFIDNLLNNKKLVKLEIIGCTFDEVDFNILKEQCIDLCFIGCEKLPFKYPSLKKIKVRGSELDFNNLDFEAVEDLEIIESKIVNAFDIDKFENIRRVTIDASILTNSQGQQIDEIKVSENTKYSHLKRILRVDSSI